MPESNQFCTFYLDGEFFGVEVTKVQEVLRYQEMTEVPLAPYPVRGLINLRGQIVTAIDMRRRLNLPEFAGDRPQMNVIVRTGGDEAVSLLVDAIGDVLEVDEELSEPPPETLKGATRDLVKRIYKLDGSLLLVLDAEQAADMSDCVNAGPRSMSPELRN